MKANAASVPYDFDGGNNVHLGLMITGPEYEILVPTAYIRPLHPGILSIPRGTTNFEATRLASEYKELIHLN